MPLVFVLSLALVLLALVLLVLVLLMMPLRFSFMATNTPIPIFTGVASTIFSFVSMSALRRHRHNTARQDKGEHYAQSEKMFMYPHVAR